MLKHYYYCLLLFTWMGLAQATDVNMKSKLEAVIPNIEIESVQPFANTGLYETIISGEIVYFSEDARYVFQGDVIEISTGENVTENKRVNMREEVLASLDGAEMIVYEPEKVEYTLTVFTDIDCGYCRKLHHQMDEYTDLGIRIRYMAYPRAGIDSDAYNKAEDVWCAKDRQQAMTDAKNGKIVNSPECDSPVKTHFELGRKLGVNGTPSLLLENGQILPGYIAPKRLKKILNEYAAQ